jgi:CubicO group peptidase (beta-lactamase class C family)
MRASHLQGLIIGLAACLSMAGRSDAQPVTQVQTEVEAATEDSRLQAFVDGAVANHMRAEGTPGAIVTIVRDGRVIMAKGYGFADLERRTATDGDRSLFRIGSISKTFIWTAIMMLADKGQIDPGQDVNLYLKGLQLDRSNGKPLTLDHLMAHRGGFETPFGMFLHQDRPRPDLTAGLKADMPARPFAPGERTIYGNWGPVLAAKIVEDVGGHPWDKFLNERITGPLGMTRTGVAPPSAMPSADRETLATPYRLKGTTPVAMAHMQIGPYAPAGGVSTTAADMARYLLMHLQGGGAGGASLMSAEGHARMWTRAFPDRSGGPDLAHGFWEKRYNGVTTFGHAGRTEAFDSYLLLVPSIGLGVFVSTNATPTQSLASSLPFLILDEVVGRPSVGKAGFAATMSGTDRSDYTGTYLTNSRSFTSFEKILSAASVMEVRTADEGELLVSSSGSHERYRPVPGVPDGFGSERGEVLVFGRNADGKVTHLTDTTGVTSFERMTAIETPAFLWGTLTALGILSITILLSAWRDTAAPRGAAPGEQSVRVGMVCGGAAGLAFLAAAAWCAATFANLSPELLAAYPFPAIQAVRIVGHLLLGLALLSPIGLWKMWRTPEWRIHRKLHVSLFVLSLVATSFALQRWNIILAPTAQPSGEILS